MARGSGDPAGTGCLGARCNAIPRQGSPPTCRRPTPTSARPPPQLRAAREELAQSGAAADSKLEGVRALLEAQSSQSAALEAALASRPTQEEVGPGGQGRLGGQGGS